MPKLLATHFFLKHFFKVLSHKECNNAQQFSFSPSARQIGTDILSLSQSAAAYTQQL
jgi:hypothetical protein